ncbi:MAG TPA: thioredoxin domain-containing protein [Phycisphaerae bacterium]|nr:thiol reductase thioredoxin [Phycisphaerales bacterium]HRX87198.1 thioredoxin domain-containing protein [Phycisphaerae bacterium]
MREPIVAEVGDADFATAVLDQPVPVVVDFWGENCPPCRALAPTLETLAIRYRGQARVVKLDVHTHSRTAAAYGIGSIPTVMVFRHGEPQAKLVGLRGLEAYTAALDAVLAAGEAAG